jgi:hypothetical protein
MGDIDPGTYKSLPEYPFCAKAGRPTALARSGKNDMLHRNTTYLVLIVLAVIGAIGVIGLLGMWLMHATMMGGMMSGGMMGCRGIMGCGGWWLVGLLVIAGVVAAVIFPMRRKPR